MFYFHKVAYVQYLGEVDIFSYMSKTFLPLYNSAKIIKIDRDFPKLWSQMYCHLFMVHSVQWDCKYKVWQQNPRLKDASTKTLLQNYWMTVIFLVII